MDCSQSLELLSEYYADSLDGTLKVEVHKHLIKCPPCHGVMAEITTIIVTAHLLQNGDALSYPDERAIWQRLNLPNH